MQCAAGLTSTSFGVRNTRIIDDNFLTVNELRVSGVEILRMIGGGASRMPRKSLAIALFATMLMGTGADAAGRIDAVRRRGFLTCGVFEFPGVAGFATIDDSGNYTGLDIDICRAMAAAIFGTPDKVRFVPAPSVAEFRRSNIDVVSRRLTWELRREAPLGLQFGPVTFYDGQGFLVSRALGVSSARQLSGVPLCVAKGTLFELQVRSYFAARDLELKVVELDSEYAFTDIGTALAEGRCRAYTADVSQLGAIRSQMPRRQDFDLLAEQISKEPLAQLVRDNDPAFFDLLRWTVFALLEAEELGLTRANVDAMLRSSNRDVQRFLGVIPGNGKALGLDERWAYNIIKNLGNYGELFDKHLGSGSEVQLERGANRLWNAGGLMFAPPLR